MQSLAILVLRRAQDEDGRRIYPLPPPEHTDALILISSPDYNQSLDEAREAAENTEEANQNVKGGSLTITAGLSIGYIIYLVRSGIIMSSVLSALPAWRLVDPLPVLGQFDSMGDEDDESIEDIVRASAENEDIAEPESQPDSESEAEPRV